MNYGTFLQPSRGQQICRCFTMTDKQSVISEYIQVKGFIYRGEDVMPLVKNMLGHLNLVSEFIRGA